MPAINHQQMQWRRELDLLSRTGVGLPAIAPAVTALLRQIVGAQTGVIMWVDASGMPTGVHHEHPNEVTQALFMNEYERLFSGEREINVSWAARQRGQACGRILNPPSYYYRSNTYNVLIRGDHYRYMLDLRIDVDGITLAVVALCRPPGKAFDEHDAVTLNSLLPTLQRACTKVASTMESSHAASGTGHLLVSADGQRIEMASDEGVALIRHSRLVGQSIELLGPMQTTPRFIYKLCDRLNTDKQATVESTVDVPGGTLHCSASWLSAVAGPVQPPLRQILVALRLQQPRAASVVRSICALGLSPLQSRIALYAASGGQRDACAKTNQVSPEALKKHLRQIYAASGARDWSDLQAHLQAAALIV